MIIAVFNGEKYFSDNVIKYFIKINIQKKTISFDMVFHVLSQLDSNQRQPG